MSSCQWRVSCVTVPPAASTAAWRWISWVTACCTARVEFTFFVSVRVPNSVAPLGISETFASQRTLPRSIRASEMSMACTMSRIAPACS